MDDRHVTEFDLERIDLDELIRDIGKWSGASFLEIFMDDLIPDIYEFSTALLPDTNLLTLSESLLGEYRKEVNNVLEYLASLNKDGEVLSSQHEFGDGFLNARSSIMNLSIGLLLKRFGMTDKTFLNNEIEFDGYRYPFSAWQLRIVCIVREYVAFLIGSLQSQSRVGKLTNFTRLRRIHVSSNARPVKSKASWDVFIASLSSLKTENYSVLSPASLPNLDFLDIMRRTLGGQERIVTSIQATIIDDLLGVKEVAKDTLHGRLSRRKVQLLRCAEDNVLILPYLNQIIFQLNDDRWIRDYDVEALQPCIGGYDEGSIRRAATVMLGFDYPKTGDPVVNDSVYRILYQHARRGELYSKHLRTQLLSLKEIEHRVDIRALETRARQVFDDSEVMAAALVREMIHDILLTKSEFSAGRVLEHNRGYEKDVYFDTFYVQGGIAALNNVRWWSGVSMLGISINEQASTAAELSGEEMRGAPVQRRSSAETTVIWTPARKSQESDKEVTKGFIENPNCLDSMVLDLLPPFAVPDNGKKLGDFKVGGYCRIKDKFDIGAPPEKKRKRLMPSRLVDVDEITPMLDMMDVSNNS